MSILNFDLKEKKLAMKVAVIGQRNLFVEDFSKYLPAETTEIISGGAKGIDSCIEIYAAKNNIKVTVIKPEYEKYGKSAPLQRNMVIVAESDIVIAFWNGESKGTAFVIENCKKQNKPCKIVYLK